MWIKEWVSTRSPPTPCSCLPVNSEHRSNEILSYISSTLSPISGSHTEGFWEVCWVLTFYKSKITFSRKLLPKLCHLYLVACPSPALCFHVKCWIIWSSDCAKGSQHGNEPQWNPGVLPAGRELLRLSQHPPYSFPFMEEWKFSSGNEAVMGDLAIKLSAHPAGPV